MITMIIMTPWKILILLLPASSGVMERMCLVCVLISNYVSGSLTWLGIIGMQDPEGTGFGLVGVAPEAEIYMYRVFSCGSSAPEDLLIRAMEKAGEEGVDVISMSLGEPWLYEHSSPFTATSSGLAAMGIATVVANGNDGASGLHQTSAPALSPDVVSRPLSENNPSTN
jgi:subtilisin family serine protease